MVGKLLDAQVSFFFIKFLFRVAHINSFFIIFATAWGRKNK